MKGKKVLMSLLALGVMMALGACRLDNSSSEDIGSSSSEPTSSEHSHSWESEWTTDETHHWHACEESSCTDVDSKAEHTGGVATETEQAKCEVCGVSYGSLKEHEHAYTVSKVDAKYLVSAADCENAAVYKKSCACGEAGTETFTDGEPLGHSWGEWETKTPADCENKEVEHRVCTTPNCGHEETRDGDAALDHDMVTKYDATHHWTECDRAGCDEATEKVVHSGGEATCIAKAICSTCNQPYGELANHVYGEWETKTPADCENAEVEHRVCTTPNCGHEETRTGDAALGHTGGTATCTAKAVCTTCGEAYGELADHVYGEWVVVEPTFDADGSRTRTCTCSHSEVEVLPKLVKVEEIEVENESLKVIEGQKVELKVNILTENAENYRIEWSSNNEKIKVVKEDGKYYAIGMALANNVASAQATVTVTVTNVLGETDYAAVTDTMEISVVNPIVEYTFDDGKALNTGTNQTVTGKVTTMSGTNVVDSTASIVYGKDSNDLENNAIKLDQKKEGGNHFTINGIDLGTNDFTIMARMNISGLVTNSNSSCYLLGIGNATDANGNVKDVKSPYFNVSYKLADGQNRVRFVIDSKVNEKNSEGSLVYLPYGEWIEVMVVRSGNNVSLVITEVDSGISSGYEITLSSEEAINFTSTSNLAFTGNSGCQNGAPSNYTYYDDIQVYDFAVGKEGSLIKHTYSEYVANTQATCTENATEIATCSVCGNSIVREVADSKLGHDWDYNDVTITVIPGLENGLAKMSCTRCEDKHDIVLPNTADYIAQYETYEEGAKLRYNLSVDPSSIDEVVAANPDLDATKLAEALATFVEAKAPSALGHEFSALVNGSLVPDTFVVGGSNKAEVKLNLTKDDKVVFYEDENLMVFGEYGVVPNGSEFTALYTGEHTFYINTKDELYATYPVNNQTYYLKPSSNWLEANARFAVYFFGNGNGWADLVDEDADGVYEVTIDINNYPTFIFVRMNPVSSENNWDYKWTQTADLVALEATGNCWVVDGWDNGSWATYPFHVHSYVEIAETPATCTATGTKAHYGCESCELKFTKDGEEYTLLNDLNSLVIPMIDHTYNVPNYDATGHWHECSCGAIEKVDDHEYVESYVIKEEKLYFVEACECGHVVESEVSAEEECLVDSKADLLTVIEAGYNAKLTSNVEVETAIVVAKDVTVDLNGKTISLPTDTVGDGVFHVTSGATLTINGEGTVNGVGANDYNMAIWADGGHVIINGGTYTNEGATAVTDPAHMDLIYVKNGGTVTINGGTFICETPEWTLNSHDTAKGNIIVKGGRFYGYNPADNTTENPVVSWVADKCVSIKNGDYYEVKGMIAEYTFANGSLSNTGVDSEIQGYGVVNSTFTKVEDSALVLAAGADGTANGGLKLAHHGSRNSLRLTNIDTGSGDFTISVKIRQDTYFGKTGSEHYLFGTSVSSLAKYVDSSTNKNVYPGKDPSAPLFSVHIGRPGSGAHQIRIYMDGQMKKIPGLVPSKQHIEYRVIKSGTTVTVSTHFEDNDTMTSTYEDSVTFTLSSADALKILPEHCLGFGANWGTQTPGNDSFYDDIRIYNYAVDFNA